MDTTVINFMSPPIPYFIGCGIEHYEIGGKHIQRFNIGVFDFVVVVKGSLFIGEEEHKWVLRENEALILCPDRHHYGTAECTEETQIHWVHFHSAGVWAQHGSMQEYLQNLLQLKDQYQDMPNNLINPISLPKHSRLSDKAINYVKELTLLQGEPRSIAAWRQQTIFQQLLQYLDLEQTLQQDLTAIQIAEKVERFIKENYRKPITNELLKQELNFHPNYLARCMRKHHGVTPMAYLSQHRIAQAKRLLLNTDYSIEKIAEEIGMELSTFSNAFKSQEGVSPSRYRKKYMNPER